MLNVNPRLAVLEGINAYSDAGHERKKFLHSEGRKFLKSVVQEVGIPAGTFDIRSNQGGIAVSGEVTLHSETLYVQLSESCMRRGVGIMFRSCNGTKDYSGHQNHFISMTDLQSNTLERSQFVARLKLLGGFTVLLDGVAVDKASLRLA